MSLLSTYIACAIAKVVGNWRSRDVIIVFVMTQTQATAEVFWTAFQAMKPAEREAFIAKLMTDKRLAEDLRYAAVIEKRKNEPTVSLDDYLTRRSPKK